ncbi:hypothetical protein [Sporosarcina sp. SG10008]|uniref:spr1630 family ClpXP-sensitive toxin n=1 Tax=Sporosarcina sp. SG10008 TaxID=3373103 RepID=UPI0037DC539D
MTVYKFSEELNIRLVRGIEQGYSDYAEVRREKRSELLVSSAYAWVKGNHIEDQVARELKVLGIECKREKAGYAWEYLSFNEPKKNHLILIKNATVIKGKSTKPILDIPNSDNYLVKLSKINSSIDFDEVKGPKQGTLTFLDLQMPSLSTEDEELEKLKKQYNHFYILTYTIDPGSRMLMDIDLWMPEFISSSRVEMVKIDSLSEYIGQTDADINLEAIHELVHVSDEEFSGTAKEFEFSSLEDVEEETSGTPVDHGIEENEEENEEEV